MVRGTGSAAAVHTIAAAGKCRMWNTSVGSTWHLKLILQCSQNCKYEECTWSQTKDTDVISLWDKLESKYRAGT